MARDAFARADVTGESVSMNEIARAAGVGAATLYRHFPTRDDLADAVYEAKLDEVTERARSAAVGREGVEPFRVWVEEFASFMLATQSMMDTLRAAWASGAAVGSPIAVKVEAIIDGFLEHARRKGTVRRDVDAADLTVAVIALLSATPPGDSGERSLRLLDLLADSLSLVAGRDQRLG